MSVSSQLSHSDVTLFVSPPPQVQGTNDSSVVSKVSAAALGYFLDPFLKSFVCKSARRAPLINRGYYVRWQAVDHCVREFLRLTAHSARRQVVSLGAGFDSLYFRLCAGGTLGGCVVFELDFPDVARRKTALMAAQPGLQEALPDWDPSTASHTGFVYSAQYRLLGVDLREVQGVESALRGAGLDPTVPTLLLSEVVLTYLDTESSDALIGWAARLLPQAVFVMYEQLRPHDPFGRVMQDHFLRLNSTLHALSQYPDTAAQTRRFLDRGWGSCVCLDMNQFYLGHLGGAERHRVEALEPFDEFEEWHLKCSHYFILVASKGSLTSQSMITPPPGKTNRSLLHSAPPLTMISLFRSVFLSGSLSLSVLPQCVCLSVCLSLPLNSNSIRAVSVGGAAPEPRHSHSACAYGEGMVVAGGLGWEGVFEGGGRVFLSLNYYVNLLSPHPNPPSPSPSVCPLTPSTSPSHQSSVPWPLMLHSHRSTLLEDSGTEALLIGGGGNCFSFGTHLNPQPVSLDLQPALC
ncbi:TYW4 protein, partial [Amia calva]|nr:TYW4 protein [Amia calva]